MMMNKHGIADGRKSSEGDNDRFIGFLRVLRRALLMVVRYIEAAYPEAK
ncbi:MAG: hypothetical protein KJ063_02375 [Anaerolineae bacterium]|nr:hypothetical protein [Anaerolineae bacterium]